MYKLYTRVRIYASVPKESQGDRFFDNWSFPPRIRWRALRVGRRHHVARIVAILDVWYENNVPGQKGVEDLRALL